MTSFYDEKELQCLGLKAIGNNVLISKKASIYEAENISIGSNVRIDDFCILSGRIKIGNYVHIAAFCGLFAGDAGIEINDFVNISSKCNVYSISDDFSGNFMTSPLIPTQYKNIEKQKIIMEKHSIIGTASTLLPGAYLNEGTALGSMSMLKSKTEPWKIYAGVPAKPKKIRNKKLLNYIDCILG